MKTYQYYIKMKEQCVDNALHYFHNSTNPIIDSRMIEFFNRAAHEFNRRAGLCKIK